MNVVILTIYWVLYILTGIITQHFFPGIDALLPGFLIALQSGNKVAVGWLFIVFVLIQEGCGNLYFGTSILWYGGHILLYQICSRLVVPTGFGGVLLFAALSGLYGICVMAFMLAIENIHVTFSVIMWECLLQTLFIPLLWLAFSGLRYRMVKYARVD